MRKDIHPKYVDCTVHCSCGNTFQTRSTKPELHVELCNKCHPFFTGQQKFVDAGGRVQRFADKYGSASDTVAKREAEKKAQRQAAVAEAAEKAKAAREAKAAAKADRAAKYAEKAASAPAPEAAPETAPVEAQSAPETDAVADEGTEAAEEK